ncbi:ABC transporter ATP-binding protein [Croceimicrobium sp.]|uniref:ABC transporter ATP-binding protein n=1 Tax=Croceimicrobium sp. TaxID=2828340 RepID=UPI003BA8CFA1
MEFNQVSFGYEKSHVVIDNLTFSIDDRDSVAIVGASGCGKSTILRLASGIIKANKQNNYTGEIKVLGQSPIEAVKSGLIGFMHQEAPLFPNLSVRDNVSLPLKLATVGSPPLVDKLIEMVGLYEYKDYLPSMLSVGMRARVSLARTFVTRPKVLFLDEPFSSLDIKWKTKLYKELEGLRAEFDARIVLVTHDIQEALLHSNNIIVLGKRGQIIKNLQIDLGLPRVYENNILFDLEKEYREIKNQILSD